MAVAFVAKYGWYRDRSLSQSSAGSVTVSGATANNLLLLFQAVYSGGYNTGSLTDTVPTGWTLVSRRVLVDAYMYNVQICRRIATGDSNDNVTASTLPTGYNTSVVLEFSGVDSASPGVGVSRDDTRLTSTGTTFPVPSITPAAIGDLVLHAVMANNGIVNDPINWNDEANYTDNIDNYHLSGSGTWDFRWREAPSTSAITGKQWTSDGGTSKGQSYSIKANAAVTGPTMATKQHMRRALHDKSMNSLGTR